MKVWRKPRKTGAETVRILSDIVVVLVLMGVGAILGLTLGLNAMVKYTQLSTPLVEKTEYVFTQQ